MGRTVEVADLVGTAEIAERLGRHRNMAHTWLRLYPAFPRPVARLAIGHVWSWADIEAWAVATGRCAAVEPAPAVRAAARFADAADLASSPEIAARLGRPRKSFNRWRRHQRSFPNPLITLEIGPVWSWTDVETWWAETEPLKRPVQASPLREWNWPPPSPAARRLFVQLVRLDGIRGLSTAGSSTSTGAGSGASTTAVASARRERRTDPERAPTAGARKGRHRTST